MILQLLDDSREHDDDLLNEPARESLWHQQLWCIYEPSTSHAAAVTE